jgi:hypothetical protein
MFNAIIWCESVVAFTTIACWIPSTFRTFFCLSYLFCASLLENIFLSCWVWFIQSRLIKFFSTFLISYESFESKSMLSIKEFTMSFDFVACTLVWAGWFLALFWIASFILCRLLVGFREDPVNYFLFYLGVSSIKLFDSISNRYLTFANCPHV